MSTPSSTPGPTRCWCTSGPTTNVFPGFGGQAFLPEPLPRMAALRKRFPDLALAVDGGLNRDTCRRCFEQGANVFDIDSALFRPDDMAKEIQFLRQHLR